VAQLVKCLTLDFGSGHWALRWAWSLLKILSPSDLPQLSLSSSSVPSTRRSRTSSAATQTSTRHCGIDCACAEVGLTLRISDE